MSPSREQTATAQATRRRIVAYIDGYQAAHGWAPTVREIADAVGLASPSSAHNHLLTLRDRGELVLGNGPRMIRLTTGRIELRSALTAGEEAGLGVAAGSDDRGLGWGPVSESSAPAVSAVPLRSRGDGRLEPGR